MKSLSKFFLVSLLLLVSSMSAFADLREVNLMGKLYGEVPWGEVQDMELDGDILVCTDQESIYLFDVSSPASPVFIASMDHSNYFDMELLDGNLYLVYPASLEIYDATGTEFTLQSDLSLLGNDNKYIDIQGNIAVVAKEGIGFSLIDVTDPTSPTVLSTGGTGLPNDVSIGGTIDGDLYYSTMSPLQSGGSAVYVYDISDPATPTFLTSSSTGQNLSIFPFEKIGDYYFLIQKNTGTNHQFIVSYSMDDDHNLVQIGSQDFNVIPINNIKVANDLLWTVRHLEMAWMEITSTGVNYVQFVSSEYRSLAVSNTTLYTAPIGNSGLDLFDVSDPENYSEIGNYGMSAEIRTIGLLGADIALIADGSTLNIVRCLADGSFEPISSHVFEYEINGDIDVLGDYAYVFTEGGMYTLDLTNPANPFEYVFGQDSWKFDIVGQYSENRALIVDRVNISTNLNVYDISNLPNLERLTMGGIGLFDEDEAIAYSETHVFTFSYDENDNELIVARRLNDSSLSQMDGSANVTGNHYDSKIIYYNNMVYIFTGGGTNATLNIVDVSVISDMVVTAPTWDYGTVLSVIGVVDDRIITATSDGYIRIFVADGQTLTLDAEFTTDGLIGYDLKFSGPNFMLMVASDQHFFTLDISSHVSVQETGDNAIPSEFALSEAYPNPFNPTTTIEYSVPAAAQISMKIYDLVGREVETLFSGHRELGNYELRFDASSYPSGVYFCRLSAPGYSQVVKLSVVK